MRYWMWIVLAGLAIGSGIMLSNTRAEPGGEQTAAGGEAKLDSMASRVSYVMGYSVGREVNDEVMSVDEQALLQGLRDATAKRDPAVSPEQMQAAFMELQKKMQAHTQTVGKANAGKAAAYLEKNAKKQGVKVTDSGLQYQVIEEGAGESPKASDTVTVHYTGKLIDGTVFDSSVERGEPATFQLNQVIPGWTEGVQLMKPGAKYRLYIPPELGYGERGSGGGAIGPNEALIFDVELIEVGAPQAQPQMPANQ